MEIIKDIATITAALIGSWVAISGLYTWKKQIKGSKEFEIAHNLNLAILKMREAIKHVRNPAIWPSESHRAIKSTKEKYPDKSEEEIKKNENSYVYEMRWQKITDAYIEAEAHLLAAEAIWGQEVVNLVKPLNKKVRELNISLNQFFVPELRTKDISIVDSIIYDQSSETEEDSFSSEISRIIKALSDYLKEKIK